MDTSQYQKFLPSKHFLKVIGVCTVLAIALLAISTLWGSHGIFNRKNTSPLVEANGTVKDLVSQDSNGNGIPDWEESLWGLDPKGDGAKNKAIIDQKKASANLVSDENPTTTNATDKFSQGLLSTIIALNQSGSLTPEAIARLSETISGNINVKHANDQTYALSDLTIVPSSSRAKATYKNAIKNILDPYADLNLGTEMGIIYSGVSEDGNSESLAGLTPYASAYSDISKKIIALKTPADISTTAVMLANASAEMSITLQQIEGLYTDTITGMVGVSDYITASKNEEIATQNLKTYFGL